MFEAGSNVTTAVDAYAFGEFPDQSKLLLLVAPCPPVRLAQCLSVSQTHPTGPSTARSIRPPGILMWQLYTGGRPYDGLAPATIIERVKKAGMRPHFPRTTPAAYLALAHGCWTAEPARRPTFDAIIGHLEVMHAQVMGVTLE
jgi:hypothetical protein